jgi:hypothetical protein
MRSTIEVKEAIVYYFESAAGFRESLIPKDQLWNPKNEKFATYLKAVIEHIKVLPDNDPTLLMLAACEKLFDEDAGFIVSDDDWQGVIHCQTDDPTVWFEDWAKGLIDGG